MGKGRYPNVKKLKQVTEFWAFKLDHLQPVESRSYQFDILSAHGRRPSILKADKTITLIISYNLITNVTEPAWYSG